MKRVFLLVLALCIAATGVYAENGNGYSYNSDGNYVALTADNDYCGAVAVGIYNSDGALVDARVFYDEVFFKNQMRRLDIDGMKTDKNGYIKVLLLDDAVSLKPGEIYSVDDVTVPTADDAKKMTADIVNKTRVLKSLLDKCAAAGIATDYEKVGYRVCEKFCVYMAADTAANELNRVKYTYGECVKLFNETSERLQRYLDGETESVSVPRYVTSAAAADGSALTAETVKDGEALTRPVYFTGYGRYDTARDDIPVFCELGINSVQQEISPADVFKKPFVWDIQYKNGTSSCPTAKKVSSPKKSGDYSMEFTYTSVTAEDTYVSICQSVALKPNTEYEYGFASYIMGCDATTNIWYSLNDFENKNVLPNENHLWQDCHNTYKTSGSSERKVFRITVAGKVRRFCADDVYVREVGTDKNLIQNSGFELPDEGDYYIDGSAADNYAEMLTTAEENNIAVNLFLNTYSMPEFLYEKYPEIKNAKTGGIVYTQGKTRNLIREYLASVLPVIKDYSAIKSVAIGDGWSSDGMESDCYKADWEKYLKDTYGNIAELNTAYAAAYSDFSEAPLSGDQSRGVRYMDFCGFCNSVRTDFDSFVTNIVKSYMPNVIICADSENDETFYLNENSVSEKPLLQSMGYEILRGTENVPVSYSKTDVLSDNKDDYGAKQAALAGTRAWQSAVHGSAITNVWIWDRAANGESDFGGSVLFRPDVIAEVGRTNLDLNRLSYEIKAVADEKAEAALLYSRTAESYKSEHTDAVYSAYETLMYNGIKTDVVMDENISGIVNADSIRVLVLPEICNISAENLNVVKNFAGSGGKVIILGEGALERDARNLAFSGDNLAAAEAIKENAVSLGLPSTDSDKAALTESMKNEIECFVELVNADDESAVSETEYTYGFYKGHLIINICSYASAGKRIKINVGGNVVGSFTELRANEDCSDGEIEIEPYSPVLIKVDKANFLLDKKGVMCIPAEGDTEKICTVTIRNEEGKLIFISQSSKPVSGVHNVKYTVAAYDAEENYTVNIGGVNGYLYSCSLKDTFNSKVYPNYESTEKLRADLEDKAQELGGLLESCAARGIATDYERMRYNIINDFIGYIGDDEKENDYTHILYYHRKCSKLYEEAKASLESYLSGKDTPKLVPKYVTSDITTDGTLMYADTELNGTTERRPVFFLGYGHFDRARNAIPVFNEYGVNTVQNVLEMKYIIRDSLYWSGYNARGAANAKFEYTKEEAHSGDWSYKFVFDQDMKDNQYITIEQTLKVKPNTKYRFGVWAKAKSAKNGTISMQDWGGRVEIPEGTYDWTEISSTYTTGDTNTAVFRFIIGDRTEALYLDDFYAIEEGTEENIVQNPGLENMSDEENFFYVDLDNDHFKTMISGLEAAEKNNIAVNLLIGVDDVPQFVKDRFPETQGKFYRLNTQSERIRKVIREYCEAIIPVIKQYKSVKTICLTNEPAEQVGNYPEYHPGYIEFLKEKYGTIDNANKAYGGSYSDFSKAPFEEFADVKSTETPEYRDYWEYNNEVFSDFHKYAAEIIKEMAPDIPLNVKVMWYLSSIDDINEFNRWRYGVNHKWYSAFEDWNGNDCALWISEVQSGYKAPMSKSFFYDYQAGVKNVPVVNAEDHFIPDRTDNFSDDQYNHTASDMWMSFFHSRTMSQLWIWDRNHETRGDFWQSILFRPDCVEAVSTVGFDINRLAEEAEAVIKADTDFAVLYSDTARVYSRDHLNAAFKAYESLWYTGNKARVLPEERLSEVYKYKALIVPNVRNISRENLNIILDYMAKGGKVLLFGTDNLMKDENNHPLEQELIDKVYAGAEVLRAESNGVLITGLTNLEIRDYIHDFAKKQGGSRIDLVDPMTGKRLDNTEFEYGVYGDDIIINICNYEYNAPKKFKIYIDGAEQNCKITELRSMSECKDATVELPAVLPIMVKIDDAANLLK